MKKLFALAAVIALVGCAEKKPLTPEEQWHGYCKSIGNAARSIMLDRQNAIEKDKAIDIYQKGMLIARSKRDMHAFSELQGAYNTAAGLDYEDD